MERFSNAAHGYFELGMPIEAEAEIEKLSAEIRADTQVLKLRHMICSAGRGISSSFFIQFFLERSKDKASENHDEPPRMCH